MKTERLKGNVFFKNIYECSRFIFFESNYLNNIDKKFIDQLYIFSTQNEFCSNLQSREKENRGKYYYSGYPTGNYLKIICKIIELWAIDGDFPLTFIEIHGIEVK